MVNGEGVVDRDGLQRSFGWGFSFWELGLPVLYGGQKQSVACVFSSVDLSPV